MAIQHFPFELPNPPYKKPGWYRARWRATREEIERLGGRICGPAEVRIHGGGTAGHVQSSPAPTGNLPTDFGDGIGPERSDPSPESGAVAGGSQASGDDPAWGTRRLP